MTWHELKNAINEMTDEQLQQEVRFVLYERSGDIVMGASIQYAKKEITSSCITCGWGGAFVIKEGEPYLD
jgi:hypothetical protein